MVPPGISRTAPSLAERRLFSLLEASDLGADAVCLHSLNLSQHRYKQMGELDFVVLAPQGLLVIEVKGGGIAVDGGVWTYTDRYGKEHRNYEGPFKQANSGMFSLKDKLEEKLSRLRTGTINFGWAVAFPDCDFDADSVEWDQALVLDAARLRNQRDLTSVLADVFWYWTRKHSKAKEVPPEVLRELLFAMRPDFELVPSLINDVDRISESMERLTEEQYERLDTISENERILCTGGAGTGKTFLALEVARRFAQEGLSVALLCGNAVLGAFLRSRLGGEQVEVIAYETDPTSAATYDVLVADEAQDYLDDEGLAVMDGLVKGGLHGGRWVVFFDPNAQSALMGRFDEDAVSYLHAMGATRASLKRNCRNTVEIVTQTTLLTGADVGVAIAGSGPAVGFGWYSDREEAVSVLLAELERLHEEAIPPGLITVLSPVSFDRSVASGLPANWIRRLVVLNADVAARWPLTTSSFATIADFKGLENQFILVVDIESLGDDPVHNSELYVSMTRARSGLWMGVPHHIRDEVAQLGKKHLHLVGGILERSRANV